MIGNESDALYIRDWYMNDYSERYKRDPQGVDLAEGWKEIGLGCFRAAFLSPDDLIYKVQHGYSEGRGDNLKEWETWKRLYCTWKLPKGARLPRMGYYNLDGRGVVVAEYLPLLLRHAWRSDEYEQYRRTRAAIERACKLSDMHEANLAIDEENKLLVPIDLGCEYYSNW